MVERCWIGASLALVLGLALMTVQQVEGWSSNETLWAHAARVTPDRPRVLINLARARLLAADSRSALELALELNARGRALTLDPRRTHRREEWQFVADTNAALGLLALQRRDEARVLIVSLLARDPTFAPAQRMAGWLE